MLNYADLIGAPYKEHGRNAAEGFDCYGLAVEVWRRLGHTLPDLYYNDVEQDNPAPYIESLPLKEITTDEIQTGALLQMTFFNSVHIGVAIDKKTFIHATKGQGVRVSKIGIIPIKAVFLWV